MTRRPLTDPEQKLAPTRSDQACVSQQMRAGGSSQQMRAGGIRVQQAR